MQLKVSTAACPGCATAPTIPGLPFGSGPGGPVMCGTAIDDSSGGAGAPRTPEQARALGCCPRPRGPARTLGYGGGHATAPGVRCSSRYELRPAPSRWRGDVAATVRAVCGSVTQSVGRVRRPGGTPLEEWQSRAGGRQAVRTAPRSKGGEPRWARGHRRRECAPARLTRRPPTCVAGAALARVSRARTAAGWRWIRCVRSSSTELGRRLLKAQACGPPASAWSPYCLRSIMRTGCPVVRAMVSKSRSQWRRVSPASSAVAASRRSTGPALRCSPFAVSCSWTTRERR